MKKLGMMAAAAAMTAGSLYAGDGVAVSKQLNISGFLDMTYQNISRDAAGASDSSTFALDQAELDFNVNLGGGLTARVDVHGGSAASVGSAAANTFDDVEIEQARIDYSVGNFNLTLGKFDTFIGLEGLEPVDLYQYSNSLSFALEPKQHTGIAGNWDNGMVNAALAVVNGISVQNTDNNDDLGFALHLGVTPSKAWAVNLNYATSDEGGTGGVATTTANESETTLFTVDVQWSNYGWTVGAEYATMEAETGSTKTADEDAWMLMVNYQFTERFAATARYSVSEGATGGDISEFTLAPSYVFTPNWSGILEYRSESVDANYAGTNGGLLGGGAGDADIITLETILSF